MIAQRLPGAQQIPGPGTQVVDMALDPGGSRVQGRLGALAPFLAAKIMAFTEVMDQFVAQANEGLQLAVQPGGLLLRKRDLHPKMRKRAFTTRIILLILRVGLFKRRISGQQRTEQLPEEGTKRAAFQTPIGFNPLGCHDDIVLRQDGLQPQLVGLQAQHAVPKLLLHDVQRREVIG